MGVVSFFLIEMGGGRGRGILTAIPSKRNMVFGVVNGSEQGLFSGSRP